MFQKTAEQLTGGIGDGQHLLVRMGRPGDAGGHIGDAGDPQHPHAQVVGHDGLRHSGHTDGVRAEDVIGTNLRRGLVAGAGEEGIDALPQRNGQGRGHPARQVVQSVVVDLRHVRKAGAEALVVGADQRVVARKVDVIGDKHQVARVEVRVDAAAGVGHDDFLHAQLFEHIDREAELPHGQSLIVVKASLHGNDGPAVQRAEHEPRGVAADIRLREAGDVGIA